MLHGSCMIVDTDVRDRYGMIIVVRTDGLTMCVITGVSTHCEYRLQSATSMTASSVYIFSAIASDC